MDIETKKLLEALSYWNAERFKTFQRKLTTAANTIASEALAPSFKVFLTADEIHTLETSLQILKGVKGKIEHAKEVKARAEKKRKHFAEAAYKAGQELWENVFPKPDNRVDIFLISVTIDPTRDFAVNYLLDDLSKYDQRGIDYWLNDLWRRSETVFIDRITSDIKTGERIMPDIEHAHRARKKYETIRGDVRRKYLAVVKKIESYETAEQSDNVEITDFSKRK